MNDVDPSMRAAVGSAQMQNESWRRHMPKAAVLVLTASLALAGCTNPDQPSDSSETWGTNFPTYNDPYTTLTDGPCDLQREVDAGKACATALKHGKIALVYFDTTTEARARAVAQQSTAMLNTLSRGVFTPSIKAVKANAKAQTELSEEIADNGGCIDSNDPEQFASIIADENTDKDMNLKKFTWVVALNGTKDCEGQSAGVTDVGGHGRDTDIFKDDKQTIMQPKVDLQNTVRSTVHEIFHLGGLGHDGTINDPTSQERFAYLTSYPYESKPVNLAKLPINKSKSGKYIEYKDDLTRTNIMGLPGEYSYVGSKKEYFPSLGNLQPIQVDQLTAPKLVHGRKLLSGKPVTIAMDGEQYAVAKLTKSVKVTPDKNSDGAGINENDPTAPVTFNEMIFEPHKAANGVSAIEVALLSHDPSTNNNIAELGLVDPGLVGDNTVVFLDGKQKFTLTFPGMKRAFKVLIDKA